MTTTTKIIMHGRDRHIPSTSVADSKIATADVNYTGHGTSCRRLSVNDHTPTSDHKYGDPVHVQRIEEVSLSSDRMEG
jgi:hypothetical protein